MATAPPEDAVQLASPWVPPRDDGAADVVDDVLRYIVDSGRQIRMAEAAARVGMSESAFSRYFTRAAGQTFSDTVRKLRLTQASQLLERTDRPIATIAHEVGYQNLSNFNRHFRAHYGCTPSGYRKQG
jgi:AraC-like DNA-binding protein